MIIEFEGRADLRIPQLGEFSVIHHEKRVVGIDVLNVALFQFGPAKQAAVVQTDHIDPLIGAVGELDQRAAHKQRHRIADPVHAARRVQHIIRHGDRTGGRIHRRIHDPHRGTDISDRRIGAVENAGKHGGHFHHQEHGEGNPDQQSEELASVIDQQLEADPQDAAVSHVRNCSWRLLQLLLAR